MVRTSKYQRKPEDTNNRNKDLGSDAEMMSKDTIEEGSTSNGSDNTAEKETSLVKSLNISSTEICFVLPQKIRWYLLNNPQDSGE